MDIQETVIIEMDELHQLISEIYELNLTYALIVYDVEVYKQIANISFNVILPLRKTNKINTEHMIKVTSVIGVGWKEYKRLSVPGNNKYSCMVNLFNILQYKFNRPLIKIKHPLKKNIYMPSSKQIDLMSETDKDSAEYKECMILLEYYEKNHNKS